MVPLWDARFPWDRSRYAGDHADAAGGTPLARLRAWHRPEGSTVTEFRVILDQPGKKRLAYLLPVTVFPLDAHLARELADGMHSMKCR